MRNRLFTFLIFILISNVNLLASIEVRSKQMIITDGLANNTVRYFLQDSKGFMWLGTLNGLNRYDGNSFISYHPSPDNDISLADRKVYDLEEDKNGFLWVSFSSEQYSCYDLKKARFVDFTGCGKFKEKYSKKILTVKGDAWLWHSNNEARRIIYDKGVFRSVAYKKSAGNLLGDNINFVTETYDGVVWIGTDKGLVRVEGNNNLFVDNEESFDHLVSYEGHTYFLTHSGKLFVFDKSSSKLILLSKLPVSSSLSVTGHFLLKEKWYMLTSVGVYCYDLNKKELMSRTTIFEENIRSANVLVDNKGNYWIYNHSGKVWYVNAKTGKKKVFQFIPEEKLGYIDFERYSIRHDSRDIIWISTYGNGLFAYDINKDELNHFTAGLNNFSHIASDYLLCVTEDQSGDIWVSSEYAGISRITIINEGSHRYFPENPSLVDRSNTIRLVSRMYNGDIWIGTRKGGLYIYDSKLRLKSSRKDFHSNIYAVERDASGKIWMGSRGDGLCIDNVWYKNDASNPKSITNDNIFYLYKDNKRRIWIGTFGGGLDLAEKKGEKYYFRHFFDKTYGQKFIRAICEDKNGMMWVGTSDGVYVFNTDSLMINPDKYYHYNYTNKKLRSNEIKYLFPDSKGNIWVATSGAGFSICTPENNYDVLEFRHYNTEEGLSNNTVQSITEDGQGDIWLATEYGISKFIQSKNIFENYFFSSYLQGNVYTENSVCQCEDGTILFGSNYGFVVFDPKVVEKSSSFFPVVFTNLNVNGINMRPGDVGSPLSESLAYSKEIRLRHNQNSIVIEFSSFNYSNIEQTMYSYKLINYDKDWSTPSPLNFAAYKMLRPGEYELQVTSCNNSGIWNDEVAVLKIRIAPPFYLTGWALLLYALFIVSILYTVYRVTLNFNRLNNKIQIEKQLTEYKLVFFTNISHEFRTPLTLIQGALDRIKRTNVNSKELTYPLLTMEKGTQRLLRLIDQLLEFRKMQNNKLALSLEETDVIAMLYEIFLSFGDMAESKNMTFQFIPSITSFKMYIDKGKLDKIIYNLLSNAFKYTPQGGKIKLYVNVEDFLEIRVNDTGVGIPKDKQNELFKRFMQSSFSGKSVGVGLHLTNELVQVHKGTISYEENQGGGSVFMVALPINANVYEEKDFLIPNNALMQEQKQILRDDYLPELTIKPNPLNEHNILVIEDDNDVRQYLKEELSSYFQVKTAEDGIVGYEWAKTNNPDLIVCDVLMPGMDGYEVTRKLKSDFDTCHIPIILLTALSSLENHLEGIESGAEAYISKPFSTRLLLTRIVKLLDQREKLKEKFSEEPGILRPAIYVSNYDKSFVDKLHSILKDNLSNSQFTIDEFASLMNVGRTGFYKKVKGVTGYSPNEYLRIMRLKKAAELLKTTKLTISEISYKVGIDDPFYFSKCFKLQFGVAPSVYQKE